MSADTAAGIVLLVSVLTLLLPGLFLLAFVERPTRRSSPEGAWTLTELRGALVARWAVPTAGLLASAGLASFFEFRGGTTLAGVAICAAIVGVWTVIHVRLGVAVYRAIATLDPLDD